MVRPLLQLCFGFALARIGTDSPPQKVGAPHPEEGAIYSCGGATMSAQAWIASGTPISYPLLVLNGLGSARIKAELVDEKRDE